MFERLLEPGCTESPACQCGEPMDIVSIEVASRGERRSCPSVPMRPVRSRDAPDGLGDTSSACGGQAASRVLNNLRKFSAIMGVEINA